MLKLFAGKLVAFAMLRLLEPECEISPAWCQEPIKSQAKRAVTLIFTTVKTEDKVTPYPAPTFSYIFYLLQALMNKFQSVIGKDDQLILQVSFCNTYGRQKSKKTPGGNYFAYICGTFT